MRGRGLAAVHGVSGLAALRRGRRSQCSSGTPVLEISLLLRLPSLSLVFLFYFFLKDEAVQYPAPERDPVARPAQL